MEFLSSYKNQNTMYDLDNSGYILQEIQRITAPPSVDTPNDKPLFKTNFGKKPKSSNHEFCDSCLEIGDLICCDRCPASFHLQCYEPPFSEETAPKGFWICRKCKSLEMNKSTTSDTNFNNYNINSNCKNSERFLPLNNVFFNNTTTSSSEYSIIFGTSYEKFNQNISQFLTEISNFGDNLNEEFKTCKPKNILNGKNLDKNSPTAHKEYFKPFKELTQKIANENPMEFSLPKYINKMPYCFPGSAKLPLPQPVTALFSEDWAQNLPETVKNQRISKTNNTPANLNQPKHASKNGSYINHNTNLASQSPALSNGSYRSKKDDYAIYQNYRSLTGQPAVLPYNKTTQSMHSYNTNFTAPVSTDEQILSNLYGVNPMGCVTLPPKLCFVCGRSCAKQLLIQCDSCPLYFHLDCLDPPITFVPPNTYWMCPNHPEHILESKYWNEEERLTDRIKIWDLISDSVQNNYKRGFPKFTSNACKVGFIRKTLSRNLNNRLKGRKLPYKPPFNYATTSRQIPPSKIPAAIIKAYDEYSHNFHNLIDTHNVTQSASSTTPYASTQSNYPNLLAPIPNTTCHKKRLKPSSNLTPAATIDTMKCSSTSNITPRLPEFAEQPRSRRIKDHDLKYLISNFLTDSDLVLNQKSVRAIPKNLNNTQEPTSSKLKPTEVNLPKPPKPHLTNGWLSPPPNVKTIQIFSPEMRNCVEVNMEHHPQISQNLHVATLTHNLLPIGVKSETLGKDGIGGINSAFIECLNNQNRTSLSSTNKNSWLLGSDLNDTAHIPIGWKGCRFLSNLHCSLTYDQTKGAYTVSNFSPWGTRIISNNTQKLVQTEIINALKGLREDEKCLCLTGRCIESINEPRNLEFSYQKPNDIKNDDKFIKNTFLFCPTISHELRNGDLIKCGCSLYRFSHVNR